MCNDGKMSVKGKTKGGTRGGTEQVSVIEKKEKKKTSDTGP